MKSFSVYPGCPVKKQNPVRCTWWGWWASCSNPSEGSVRPHSASPSCCLVLWGRLATPRWRRVGSTQERGSRGQSDPAPTGPLSSPLVGRDNLMMAPSRPAGPFRSLWTPNQISRSYKYMGRCGTASRRTRWSMRRVCVQLGLAKKGTISYSFTWPIRDISFMTGRMEVHPYCTQTSLPYPCPFCLVGRMATNNVILVSTGSETARPRPRRWSRTQAARGGHRGPYLKSSLPAGRRRRQPPGGWPKSKKTSPEATLGRRPEAAVPALRLARPRWAAAACDDIIYQ